MNLSDTPHIRGTSCITKLNYKYEEWYEILLIVSKANYKVDRTNELFQCSIIEYYYDQSFDPSEVAFLLFHCN